jgi:prevent-host-death family protein
MKTMAISQFKAHALKIIDEISQNHETIIVTKRGKPLAKILPYEEA